MLKWTEELSIGPVTLVEEEDAVTNLLFTDGSEFECDAVETPLMAKSFTQIREYLAGKRTLFTMDYRLPDEEGFEAQVWELLRRLPYGETYPIECITQGHGLPLNDDTKAEIIDIIELNPLPILVPCHRVVEPGLKYPAGEQMKKKLIALEKHC